MIPPGRPLRVVGDVHGDTRAFAFAGPGNSIVNGSVLTGSAAVGVLAGACACSGGAR